MEKKERIPLWLYPSTIKTMDVMYPADNCNSRSAFIEKAIHFYCGYISAGSALEFLPPAITSVVSGIVEASEHRIARLLFKLAVEMSMMMHVLADTSEIGDGYLRKLRGRCVAEVKKSLGAITLDEVVRQSVDEAE